MAHRIEDNSFVMVRPKDDEDQLKVEQLVSHQERQDRENLYLGSFERLFLNSQDSLADDIHKRCLNLILPTIALVLFHEMPEMCNEIREDFLFCANKNQISKFESLPDQETGLHYILSEYLSQFRDIILKEGIESAVEEFPLFFESIKNVYMGLPAVYIFNLIDAAHDS